VNPLDTYLTLRAAEQGRAIACVSRRHVHLAIRPRPLVVVGYHLAGDLGAPVALTWGTAPGSGNAETIVVPEPRNRTLRFEALRRFGDALDDYLRNFEQTAPVPRGRVTDDVCVAAPQLVLANSATADWLYDIVGRFTRSLPSDGDDPVPPSVSRAGKHLSFFGGMRRVPGSCLTLVATEALTGHFRTGQLDAEDMNLAALLGWIEPGEGETGPQAARAAERRPPAGPISDPGWDVDHLQRFIADWHAARTDAARAEARERARLGVGEQHLGTYNDCWRALRQLYRFDEAGHVAARAEQDRREWTRHMARMAAGTARFRNIPTPLQAARSLRRSEDATTALATAMAIDDTAVMARSVASGEALAGRVVAVDATHREVVNRRRVRRPLIDIDPMVEFHRPVGTTMFLASAPSVRVEIVEAAGRIMRLRVTKGALTAATMGALPTQGQDAIFSPHELGEFYPRALPEETPWTHVPNDAEGDS
jgi:hypothetical protein